MHGSGVHNRERQRCACCRIRDRADGGTVPVASKSEIGTIKRASSWVQKHPSGDVSQLATVGFDKLKQQE